MHKKKKIGVEIPMRKKMIKNMIIILSVCSICLMYSTWRMVSRVYYERESEYLKSTMEQLIEVLNTANKKRETAKQLFLDDYLNRIYYVKMALESINENYSQEAVDLLLHSADISKYYYVDANGIIQNSNDASALGINFYNDELLSEFIPLIEGRDEDGYTLQLDAVSVLDGNRHSYLGIALEGGGMFQIEVETETIDRYMESSSLETSINSIPTKESEIIFAINPSNDELIAITKNNKQKVDIDNRVDTLKKASEEPITIIGNGNKVILYTQEYNGVFLGIGTRYNEVIKPVKTMFIRVTCIILILFIIVCIYIYGAVKWFVIDDLNNIMIKLKEFCRGNKSITINSKRTKEMTEFSMQLNDVLSIIENKGSSISQIASFVGEKYGAYEYYYKINHLYYSDNIPKMFGLSDEECKQAVLDFFANTSYEFDDNRKKYIEVQEITTKVGRIVRVQRAIYKDAIYGFIEDISDEKALEAQLLEEKDKSYLDALTGLYNRKMIEEYAELEEKNNNKLQGIMMLIDLDNFKKVNDEKGHIEGDIVLKEFAKILNKSFRDSDIKVRLGGDEFMVYIQNSMSLDILERKISNFISNVKKQLKSYYEECKLSVSVGAVYCEEEYKGFEHIYELADKAMYVAKRKGKDGYYIKTRDS